MTLFSFNDYDRLSWLVLHLFHENFADSIDEFSGLLRFQAEPYFEKLSDFQPAEDFFHKAVNAVREKELETGEQYKLPVKLNIVQQEEIYVEPVSFFRWAEKQSICLSKPIIKAIEEHEKLIRPSNFHQHRLSKAEFDKLAKQDLWDLHTAILHVMGYKGCSVLKTNYLIIHSTPDLRGVFCSAIDSYEAGKLNLSKGCTYGQDKHSNWESCYTVSPQSIIEWTVRVLGFQPPQKAKRAKSQSTVGYTAHASEDEHLKQIRVLESHKLTRDQEEKKVREQLGSRFFRDHYRAAVRSLNRKTGRPPKSSK